jgi:hypothetical protein
MNIITVTVGAAVMGTLMPGVMHMSIAPFEAQVRAQNFAIAETAAVTFAAQAEGAQSVSSVPDGCGLNNLGNAVYTVTCAHGQGAYRQEVSRTLRLTTSSTDDGNNGHGNDVDGYDESNPGNSRKFPNKTPKNISFTHQCLETDAWGLNWWNDTYENAVGACMPSVAWTEEQYFASNPDNWLYDINNINGWGEHPDY